MRDALFRATTSPFVHGYVTSAEGLCPRRCARSDVCLSSTCSFPDREVQDFDSDRARNINFLLVVKRREFRPVGYRCRVPATAFYKRRGFLRPNGATDEQTYCARTRQSIQSTILSLLLLRNVDVGVRSLNVHFRTRHSRSRCTVVSLHRGTPACPVRRRSQPTLQHCRGMLVLQQPQASTKASIGPRPVQGDSRGSRPAR